MKNLIKVAVAAATMSATFAFAMLPMRKIMQPQSNLHQSLFYR